MKTRFLKAKHWLVVSVMALLGLLSCEKGCPEPGFNDTTGIVPMYGVQETPFAHKH